VFPQSQTYKFYADNSSEEASIHGEDEAFLEKTSNVKPRRRSRLSSALGCCFSVFTPSVIACALSIFTAAVVVILLLVLVKERPFTSSLLYKSPQKGPLKQYHCGETPQEAKALGCVFDIMSFAWTPPGKRQNTSFQLQVNVLKV
jgi:hypothetical protein